MEVGPAEKSSDPGLREWVKPELVVLEVSETRAQPSGNTSEGGPPFMATS